MHDQVLEALRDGLQPIVVAYQAHEPLDYEGLFPSVRAACPPTGEFVVLAESFSGPLAVMLAASEPQGLRGIILCASFIRSPLWTPFRWIAAAARPGYFRLAP